MTKQEAFWDKIIGTIIGVGMLLGCFADSEAQESCQELEKPKEAICYKETTPVYYCQKLYGEDNYNWVSGCQSTKLKEFGYVTEKNETPERKAMKHERVVLRVKSLLLYRKAKAEGLR